MPLYSSLVAPFLYCSTVCVCVCVCVCTQQCQTLCGPWIVAHQSSLPMEFSTQAYCSGLPFPILGGLPDPGIQPTSLSLSGGFFTASAIWETHWSTGAHSVVVLWYTVLSFVYLMYPTVIISQYISKYIFYYYILFPSIYPSIYPNSSIRHQFEVYYFSIYRVQYIISQYIS